MLCTHVFQKFLLYEIGIFSCMLFVLESLSKLFVVPALVWVLLCDQLKLSSDWTGTEGLSSALPSAAPIILLHSSWDQYWCSWLAVLKIEGHQIYIAWWWGRGGSHLLIVTWCYLLRFLRWRKMIKKPYFWLSKLFVISAGISVWLVVPAPNSSGIVVQITSYMWRCFSQSCSKQKFIWSSCDLFGPPAIHFNVSLNYFLVT